VYLLDDLSGQSKKTILKMGIYDASIVASPPPDLSTRSFSEVKLAT
jgi:hypothetical protein